ncbi:hypothetical protein ACLK10_02425 [Escherichia coli]
MALRGYKVADDRLWARKLFGFSIIAITALSVMMSVDLMVPDCIRCWLLCGNKTSHQKGATAPFFLALETYPSRNIY